MHEFVKPKPVKDPEIAVVAQYGRLNRYVELSVYAFGKFCCCFLFNTGLHLLINVYSLTAYAQPLNGSGVLLHKMYMINHIMLACESILCLAMCACMTRAPLTFLKILHDCMCTNITHTCVSTCVTINARG